MTVEELIAELQKYPPHFVVKPYYFCELTGEQSGDFLRINNFPNEKIVNIEVVGI